MNVPPAAQAGPTFEYSTGVRLIEDEAQSTPRQFPFSEKVYEVARNDKGQIIIISGDRMTRTKTALISISGLAHIGIRVHDLERSVRFYELLGFEKTAGPIGPEPVAILEHPSGVELNLILNATYASEANVLMDTPEKHAGITHFALLCSDIMAAKEQLEAAGFPLSDGPVRFGPRAQGIFVRDPDRNVIELHQRG
jgi:lactoylglutathione lyase